MDAVEACLPRLKGRHFCYGTEMVSDSRFHPRRPMAGFDAPAGKAMVMVRWSPGIVEHFASLPANQLVTLREGVGPVKGRPFAARA